MPSLQSENHPGFVRDPLRVFLWLCASIVGLVCVGALVELLDYRFDVPVFSMLDRMFDLDRESNVPTWASSSLLLLAAFELFAVSRTDLEHARRYRLRWVLLGVIFVLLSLDESARLHERLGDVLLGAAEDGTNPFLRNRWVLVYGMVLVPVVALYLRFVLELPGKTSLLVFVAGIVYIGGALGLELLESVAQGSGEREAGLVMFLLTTAQEAAEMFGVAVLIYAVGEYRISGAATSNKPCSAIDQPGRLAEPVS